jgi:hypothetical protein
MTPDPISSLMPLVSRDRRVVDAANPRPTRSCAEGGETRRRVTLGEGLMSTDPQSVDVLALDEALTRLAVLDPEQARIPSSSGAQSIARFSQARAMAHWRLTVAGKVATTSAVSSAAEGAVPRRVGSSS